MLCGETGKDQQHDGENIYFNFMDPTRILKLLDMKVAFIIYVGLSGMIGAI